MVYQETLSYSDAVKKKGKVKEVDMRIGERLKELREIKNLSQTEWADILDISFQQFQKYEKGSNRISFASILMLSHALKIPLQDFAVQIDDEAIGLSDNKQASIAGYATNEGLSRKEIKELLSLFHSVEDPKTRKYLIKFIKGMVENKD